MADPTTSPSVGPAPTRFCFRDGNEIPDGAVLVGVVEQGSGPGRSIHACPACVRDEDLLSYDQHPADSDGTPRHRNGEPVWPLLP